MKKIIVFELVLICVLTLASYASEKSEIAKSSETDYPAAIMVNDTIYYLTENIIEDINENV